MPNQTPSPLSDLLPAWTYQNSEFLALEIDSLFRANWMLAGHISELPEANSYLTFEGFGERVLILRNTDGVLRAFHNVCRHRGAPLLEGRGNNCPMMLSCPFHGWTYDRNGRCVAIPASSTFPNINIDEKSLIPVEVEEWMGFIFIRITAGGPTLAEQLAPVAHLIEPYQTESMIPLPGSAYRQVRPYNWKVIHDIDNEGYHVPVGHPSLQQLYGKTYEDSFIEGIAVSKGEVNSRKAKSWSVARYQTLLPEFDHLPEENQRLWLYIGIYPNMVLGLYPESIEFYMTLPKSVNETVYLGQSFGLPDDRREVHAARYLSQRINSITDREDELYVRYMQEGLQSSVRPEPCLSTIENGVQHFHHRLQELIPVGRLPDAPSHQSLKEANSVMLSEQ